VYLAKLGILFVFIAHSALTFWAWTDHGYAGFFPPFTDSNTTQIFSDLVISVSLVNIWIYFDLKKHKQKTYWFFIVLLGTACSGSFAPLTYLLFRDKLISSAAT
jgi:hypothetical protein